MGGYLFWKQVEAQHDAEDAVIRLEEWSDYCRQRALFFPLWDKLPLNDYEILDWETMG